MQTLQAAHAAVGGDVLSGGGTGTWDINTWVTELQAGSFTLMDTAYELVGVPFQPALAVVGTVISAKPSSDTSKTFAAADVGAKAVGMDHGNPSIHGASVWYCSDEHVGFSGLTAAVGDRVLVWPAHVDPTVAMHERFHLVEHFGDTPEATLDEEIIDQWEIDLRHW
jgi:D-serine deaminase-like pyridoxal phosphate-dependent protein